jgi:hypothetical protein
MNLECKFCEIFSGVVSATRIRVQGLTLILHHVINHVTALYNTPLLILHSIEKL